MKESISILEMGFGTGLNAFTHLKYRNESRIQYGVEPIQSAQRVILHELCKQN
jgi:tRNA U34 5-methylaminomethyl-2-thiouridine-forming methyltransferase MnmC